MVTVPLDLLNLLLAAVLPIVTALVTARFAQSAVKTLVLVLLTVISTALQQVFDDGGSFEAREFIMTTTYQFIASVALHFGLLKPLAVTGERGIVASSVPAGIGGPSQQIAPSTDSQP